MKRRGKSYRLLLVDQVAAVRQALCWALEDSPDLCVAGEVDDGEKALAAALDLQPDVVILDIDLPHVNGLEVARALKSFPHPPLVVFLTVRGNAVLRKQAAAAGGDGFVEKSEGWPALMTVIQDLLAVR